MVLYGTHAARPPADEKTPPRTIYVENDRGAIYQHQAGFWQYLAGTMWGTLSPRSKADRLGHHDAGFDFRGPTSRGNSSGARPHGWRLLRSAER